MTQAAPPQAARQGFLNHKITIQLYLLGLLSILADWLFFEREIGLSLPIFLTCLAISAFTVRRHHSLNKVRNADFVILVLAMLPGVETFNLLTASIGILGVIIFTLKVNNNLRKTLFQGLLILKNFIITAPLRLIQDIPLIKQLFKRTTGIKGTYTKIISIIFLPILLTLCFLTLFAQANPLIGQWFDNFDIFYFFKQFNINRIIFLGAIAVAIWPLLRVPAKIYKRPKVKSLPSVPSSKETQTPIAQFLNRYLGNTSVLQSLVMFNILFAVQTYLDLVYLWGQGTLPAGISYSQYVHKGTYILILTALLAAAFILLVMRETHKKKVSPLIKGLLYVWTVQNIILVISTMMRMGLYVEAFALTYLRVAVLIWMGLVMIGLALILIRLLLNRQNIWLVKANIISLALVLYITSFVNFPYIISEYNVNVAIENPNKILDLNYLSSLGQAALPAMEKVTKQPRWDNYYVRVNYKNYYLPNIQFRSFTSMVEKEFLQTPREWHQWSFRDHRLKKYLLNSEKGAQ